MYVWPMRGNGLRVVPSNEWVEICEQLSIYIL